MIEKRILNLSPIGKKLDGPPETYGRHLGFRALGPKSYSGAHVNIEKCFYYASVVLKTLEKLKCGGGHRGVYSGLRLCGDLFPDG